MWELKSMDKPVCVIVWEQAFLPGLYSVVHTNVHKVNIISKDKKSPDILKKKKRAMFDSVTETLNRSLEFKM